MNSFESFDQPQLHQCSALYEGIDFNIDAEIDHLFQNYIAFSPKQSYKTESPLRACDKQKNQRLVPLLSTASTVDHSENNVSPQTSSEQPKILNKKSLKKRSRPAKKPWRQNLMKNHQGTLAAIIKKMCQTIENTGEETNLFRTATYKLTKEEKQTFRQWVATCQKSFKTWKKLKQFMGSNTGFGIIFAEMIMFLLTDLYKDEYEESLQKGKMSAKNKALLEEQESKNFYIWKLTLIRDELIGFETNFKKNIKKPREAPQKKLKV